MDDTTGTAPAQEATEPTLTNITIQGLVFEVDRPYVAGPIELTPGEAHALNQTRAENLRNGFAAQIKAAADNYRKVNNVPEGTEVAVTLLDKEELDEEFAKYASEYEFGIRSGGGARAPVDPIEREAVRIATAKVKEALAKQNPPIKVSTVSKERMADLVKAVIAKYPAITEEAKRRVESAGDIAIDSLSPAA